MTWDALASKVVDERRCEVILREGDAFRIAWSGAMAYDATRAARDHFDLEPAEAEVHHEDGRRFLANTPDDAAVLDSLVTREGVGRTGRVAPHGDGTNRFDLD